MLIQLTSVGIIDVLYAFYILIRGSEAKDNLANAHPETDVYCERLTDTIYSPLDLVIWNNQTPISSRTYLESLSRSHNDPVSG